MHGPIEGQFAFKCSTCGKTHVGWPDLAFDAPFQYDTMSEKERCETAELTTDTCIIAGEDFFVRGCLEIPVRGRSVPFAYGVWVSLSSKNFQRYQELFVRSDRLDEPPYFGWFSNRLPGYPDALNLKTDVIPQPYPLRPRIELHETDHSYKSSGTESLCNACRQSWRPMSMPPNKRLKLAGGDRFKGSGVLCPSGHELTFNITAPCGRVARSLSAIR